MNKLICIIFVLLPLILHAQKKQGKARVDSLLQELTSESYHNRKDTNKIKLLNTISYGFNSYNPDEGIKYGSQAFNLAEELNWPKGVASAYNSLNANYIAKGNFELAKEYCLKALKIYEKLGDKNSISKVLGNLANACLDLGDIPKALLYQLKSLEMAEEAGNKKLIASCQMNIGNIYTTLGNYKIALSYLEGALALQQELENKNEIAECLANIGSIYLLENKNAQALDFYQRSIILFEELGNLEGLQSSLSNSGNIYRSIGNYNKALEYEFRSLKLCEDIGNNEGIAGVLGEIGTTYIRMATDSSRKISAKARNDNSSKAISFLERSLELGKQTNALNIIANTHKELAIAYKLSGRYAESIKNYELYIATRDSVYSNDNKLKIAELGTQREAALKEKQIEINRIQAKHTQNEEYLYVLGMTLLSIIMILLLRNYYKKKERNAKLETALNLLAAKKLKADNLTVSLQESIRLKDELVAQVESSAAMKSNFLANISHELRTPVTLLTGMLELMRNNTSASNENVKLELAYNNSRRLQYMVDELLNLSKLEGSDWKLNSKTKEVAPLLKRMVGAFETIMQEKHLTLDFVDNASGLYFSVDEDRFEKIINNLIYNSIKFNEKGGWIKVVVGPSDDKNCVSITISNTGTGISAGDLPHIFERFYQGDTGKARAEGAGIGLALVKEFTIIQGGSVEVASIPGSITTFTLHFPLTEKGTEETEIEMLPAPVKEWEHFPERQTVLLVEDNAEMRYYLREVLGEKVNLAEAGNGKEALKWMENNAPNLIISDIMMPQMDGREFVKALKDHSTYKKIPVITLSALADIDSRIGLLRMGVDDYIVKPFSADELRVRVYNLLNNYGERILFSQQPAESDDIPLDSKAADELRGKISTFVLARLSNTTISVFDLAYELSLSERQLYRLSKSLTGCTPLQLIKEVRLQKAYELLLSNKIYKLDDIAERVGFETTAYFSRQFYERFGKKATDFM